MPDADDARIVAAQVTGEIFNLFSDTRLATIAPRIAWGIVNSFHKVAQQPSSQADAAASALGGLARVLDPSAIPAVNSGESPRLVKSPHQTLAVLQGKADPTT